MKRRVVKEIDGVLHKKCVTENCGWKTLDKFSYNGTSKTGEIIYRGQCKLCRNPPVQLKEETERKCNTCNKKKPIDEFPITGKTTDIKKHRRFMCTVCYNESRRVVKKEFLTSEQNEHKETFDDSLELVKKKSIEELVYQTCRTCNKVKETGLFIKNGNGIRVDCKECYGRVEYNREEGVILKICGDCENLCRPELLNGEKCIVCDPRPIVKVADKMKKQCKGLCKRVLPLESMVMHSTAKGKICYRALCQDCNRLKQRNIFYLTRNADRLIVDDVPNKFCNDCENWFPENKYLKSEKQTDGLNDNCKDCYYKKFAMLKELNREAYRIQTNKRINERLNTDPLFKLQHTIRKRIWDALNRGIKLNSTNEYIGCTFKEYFDNLERQFREGMTWENHGDWHIDHIVPVASFDRDSETELMKAFNYKNTQPLWKNENRFKSDKTDLNPEDYIKGKNYIF